MRLYSVGSRWFMLERTLDKIKNTDNTETKTTKKKHNAEHSKIKLAWF